MIRKQFNILRLSIDNLRRRWRIYTLLAGATGLGTAVILCLFFSADLLKRTAQLNLMSLPLNKLRVYPGDSADGTGERNGDISSEEIDMLRQDPDVLRVWPQIDYGRSAQIYITVRLPRTNPQPYHITVEVFGVPKKLIEQDLFKGSSFAYSGKANEPVPLIFPERVVNMMKRGIEQKLNNLILIPANYVKMIDVHIELNVKRGLFTSGTQPINCVPAGSSLNIQQNGVAVPMEAVREWNRKYAREKDPGAYSRVLIETAHPEKAAQIAEELEKKGYHIESSRSTFEQIQNMFAGVHGAVAVFGFLIVLSIGAGLFNGMNLVVFAERDIIGVMRAVGAKRRDILESLLLQSVITGIAGGIFGTAAAFGTGFIIEQPLISLIRDYGISADSFIIFRPVWAAGGILVPPLVCVIFGLLPALSASAKEPCEVLK